MKDNNITNESNLPKEVKMRGRVIIIGQKNLGRMALYALEFMVLTVEGQYITPPNNPLSSDQKDAIKKLWRNIKKQQTNLSSGQQGGNIAKGLTQEQKDKWKKNIEEKSDAVRKANQGVISLVKKRAQNLLANKDIFIQQLQDCGLDSGAINIVMATLSNVENNFNWFYAKDFIKGREIYLCGCDTALAIDIIQALLEKEAELGIPDLIEEYIVHEILERITMGDLSPEEKHHAIIKFTSKIFKRGEFKKHGHTPLGKALGEFLDRNVVPGGIDFSRSLLQQGMTKISNLATSQIKKIGNIYENTGDIAISSETFLGLDYKIIDIVSTPTAK